MTISANQRNQLIEYRLKQAAESLAIAEILIGLQNYPTALNRIYYSVFYCLLAVGLKNNFKTSKHAQLIGWFNKNFIATGKIESKYGKIIRKTYEYRLMADYDAYVEFDKESIEQLLLHSTELTSRIKELLK